MIRKLLFRGPVLTASGYGNHARQVLRALLQMGTFDVSVSPISWGHTPFIFSEDEWFKTIRELAVKFELEQSQGMKDYDLSVQVTIPNEFQKLARINIGVTAGIEVDRVSPEWITKCNENVDLVIVPSKHSADTMRVEYRSNDGRSLRLNKPIAIVPEGVDVSLFNNDQTDVSLVELEPDFNFLAVGLGLDKGFGEDRKNISSLIKWFCESFKDQHDVGLVLKVSTVNNSLMDFEKTKAQIEELKRAAGCTGKYPVVTLVHGRLSDAELATLYKHPKIKAMVSMTHGEGFGLPLVEAAACDLPVIATGWSGHLDFLAVDGKNRFIPIEYDLTQIPQSAVWNGVMEAGTRWAVPKENDAKLKMKKVVLSYEKPKEWATELGESVRKNFSLERTAEVFSQTIESFLSQVTSPRNENEFVKYIKDSLKFTDKKTLIYTMPMSAGDVYISTAVIDSLRKKYPDHVFYFATQEQYVSILKDNKDIDHIIRFEPWMQNVPVMERIFDEVFTPNLAIQMVSANWVRGGKGRRLGEEMAAQCNVELGEYKISVAPIDGLPEHFIAFQPGSGKGQWEARNYLHWNEVIKNIVAGTNVKVVQLGTTDDPLYEGCVDFRGKTTYNQLAYVVERSALLLSIDTVAMHMAAGLGIPHVAIFGSSYANSTGPAKSKSLSVLIETKDRYDCEKACYKYQCSVDADHPCINEISGFEIFSQTIKALAKGGGEWLQLTPDYTYQEYNPKVSGYTHIFNPERHGFPYLESIRSMLGFCDEVVVIDGGSDDGSVEKLKAIGDDRIKIYDRAWDWSEPGMDGMQKAYGRAMCSGEFLWQQDADEVVHEEDYKKIRDLVKRFPKNFDLIDLPVVELWGGEKLFRTDRHPWKWRLSRNNFQITHGINKNARVVDEKTGKIYARKMMSDGCEYIDIMTGEFIPHRTFYTQELEHMRRFNPEQYGVEMNKLFEKLPCVFHYSWANIPRKIRNFRDFWDKAWSNLYNEEKKEQRFFMGRDMSSVTDEDILTASIELSARGGEHGQSAPQFLSRSNPANMKDWIASITEEYKGK